MGEFKDDCIQDHTHQLYANGYDANSTSNDMVAGTSNMAAHRNKFWGIQKGRTGDVTRGKRKGVKYIIKVL